VSDNGQISTLVPLANATKPPASGPSCGSACVALLLQDPPGPAPLQPLCYMNTAATVITAPAAGGPTDPSLTFIGDTSGRLYAESATEAGNCVEQGRVLTGYGAVVGGPLVLANG